MKQASLERTRMARVGQVGRQATCGGLPIRLSPSTGVPFLKAEGRRQEAECSGRHGAATEGSGPVPLCNPFTPPA